MSAEPVYLLNVPVEHGFRDMLRVYALPEVGNPEVEVSYYQPVQEFDLGSASRTPLRTDRIRLRTFDPIAGFLVQPSLIEIAGVEALPEIVGKTSLWIEVNH